MFGINSVTKIDRYTAVRIAEAMNCWAGKDYRKQIISADEVMKLSPVPTYESKNGSKGYTVFAYQWGDVTILARISNNGDIHVQNVCW